MGILKLVRCPLSVVRCKEALTIRYRATIKAATSTEKNLKIQIAHQQLTGLQQRTMDNGQRTGLTTDNGQRTTDRSTPSPSSSKNPTARPRNNTWPPATTTGTAACSCSRLRAFCASWRNSRRRWSPAAATRWRRPSATWISPGLTPRRSPPARAIPSTTR